MSIPINLTGDCTTSNLGTGLGDCVDLYGDLQGIGLYQKGFNVGIAPPTESEYKDFVQGETVYPINQLFGFTDNTPEDENATGSTGIMSKIRAGKPLYAIDYDKGGCFHESISDKEGQNRWDLSFVFEKGVLYAHNVDVTALKGFNAGMFSVGTFKFLQGTDPENTKVIFQLNTALEMNMQKAFFTWETLGYNMNDVNGIINATLNYETTPVAGLTVSVEAKALCNGSVDVLGLDGANNWELGGVQATLTTISGVVFNVATNSYDITFAPILVSTDTVQPRLRDDAKSFDAAVSASGDFFKGTAPLATIA